MKCICGQNANYGKWCSERYYDCPEYKRKLSVKAKARGNNGVRGRLSKNPNWTVNEKVLREPICSSCNKKYKRIYSNDTFYRSTFIPICDPCVRKKIEKTRKKNWFDKLLNGKYESLSYNARRHRLWIEQGKKCYECGYNKYDLKTGPYELHHIDENKKEPCRENEVLLCCNCHAMTHNYRFKGRTHENYPKKNKNL